MANSCSQSDDDTQKLSSHQTINKNDCRTPAATILRPCGGELGIIVDLSKLWQIENVIFSLQLHPSDYNQIEGKGNHKWNLKFSNHWKDLRDLKAELRGHGVDKSLPSLCLFLYLYNRITVTSNYFVIDICIRKSDNWSFYFENILQQTRQCEPGDIYLIVRWIILPWTIVFCNESMSWHSILS